MFLYDIARRVKHSIRDYKKQHDCSFLSPVRRIERVAPIPGRRLCAMTFDDGPSDIGTNPPCTDDGLTLHLLKTLERFGARGTFDVIGSTADNYPDNLGKHGSFSWGGVKYDHYPDFNKDARGGAKNRPDLISRILEGGHEITNHGYRHILFGHIKLVYGARACFHNLREVVDDLSELDELMVSSHQYKMRLGRPPHYVDKIPDGHNTYDAYRYLNYQYLAASFDGGGWLPSCGDTARDVTAMVEPLEMALFESRNALNGEIIFQKDGYSMSRHTPVAEALPQQLALLSENEYEVMTVSELLSISPFADVFDTDARELANAGYVVAYRNNTLQPERVLTFGELVMMSADPSRLLEKYRAFVDAGDKASTDDVSAAAAFGVSPSHPYFFAFVLAAEHGVTPLTRSWKSPVTEAIFAQYISALFPSAGYESNRGEDTVLSRGNAFPTLRHALIPESDAAL